MKKVNAPVAALLRLLAALAIYFGSGSLHAVGAASQSSPGAKVDLPQIYFEKTTATLSEDAFVEFNVLLSKPSADRVTMKFKVHDISTNPAIDHYCFWYPAPPGTDPSVITLLPGASSAKLMVMARGDMVYEVDEMLNIELVAISGITVGAPALATVTIQNKTRRPELTFPTAQREVYESAGTIRIIGTINLPSEIPLDYLVESHGTAEIGTDFLTTTVLHFAPTQTTAALPITILPDGNTEGPEEARITFIPPPGFTGAVADIQIFDSAAGEGDMDFTAPVPVPLSGVNVTAIATADFDGDAHLDLCTASASNGRISWLRNIPGSPQPLWQQFPLATFVRGVNSVAAGDINLDGKPDVISGTGRNGRVNLHTNSGGNSPIFGTQQIARNLPGILDVFLADVDRDGDLDVIVATQLRGRIVWLENPRSSGTTLWPARPVATVPGLNAVAITDLDVDGDIDVVCATRSGSLTWLENRGKGITYLSHLIAKERAQLRSIWIADLNADAHPDILCGDYRQTLAYENQLVTNSGFAKIAPPAEAATKHVSPVDYDNDGDLDLVFLRPDGSITLSKNTGTRQSPLYTTSNLGQQKYANALLPIDFDNDGDKDIIAGGGYNLGSILNHTKHHPIAFAEPVSVGSYLGSIPRAADLDLDGNIDLFNGTLNEWSRNLGGHNPLWDTKPVPATEGSWLFELWDADGDVDADALFYHFPNRSLELMLNDRNGGFASTGTSVTLPANISIGETAGPWQPADFDHDGDLDLVVNGGNNLGAAPVVIENRTGETNPVAIFTLPGITGSLLAIADFNKDGYLDLLTANGSSLTIYRNLRTSPVSFEHARTIVAEAGNIIDGTAADFDLDGDIDIAYSSATSLNHHRLNVLECITSDLNYVALPPSDFPGTSLISHAVAMRLGTTDIDNDGDQDITVGTFASHMVVRNPRQLIDNFDSVLMHFIPDYIRHTVYADVNGDGRMDAVAGPSDGQMGLILGVKE